MHVRSYLHKFYDAIMYLQLLPNFSKREKASKNMSSQSVIDE